MSVGPVEVVSHAQKVLRLYRAGLRTIHSYYHYRHLMRYHSVLLRARFDENKDVIDPRTAKKLLQEGEKELFLKMHPQPFKFPNSPGGQAYGREPRDPDWMLDMWHPLERAAYPEYFARRDQRKMEFIKAYEEKYGKAEEHGH